MGSLVEQELGSDENLEPTAAAAEPPQIAVLQDVVVLLHSSLLPVDAIEPLRLAVALAVDQPALLHAGLIQQHTDSKYTDSKYTDSQHWSTANPMSHRRIRTEQHSRTGL
jgi:hypothetical protein